jgi:membrane fusion protein (multidrug efflux system)
MVVPQTAVQQSQKGSFVFVIDEENRAQVRMIEPGPWEGRKWVINRGLKTGDKVIVGGVNKVLPGSLVKIVNDLKEPKTQSKDGSHS